MLFGRYGWVRMSEKWIAEWKKEFKVCQRKQPVKKSLFQYHRVSQVSRDILFMAEDLKVFLAINLEHWEGKYCSTL